MYHHSGLYQLSNLRGIKENFLGKIGRRTPFCIFQSIGFMLVASTFIRISS
ncbi:hypothetical protein Hanom_Chr01g00008861 [Helianthus anomalus]